MWDSRCIDCIITPVLLKDPHPSPPLPSPPFKHPKKVHAHMIRHCTVLVPRFKSIFRIGERKKKKMKKKNIYPPTRPRHCAKKKNDGRFPACTATATSRVRPRAWRSGRLCRIAWQPPAVNPPFASLFVRLRTTDVLGKVPSASLCLPQ